MDGLGFGLPSGDCFSRGRGCGSCGKRGRWAGAFSKGCGKARRFLGAAFHSPADSIARCLGGRGLCSKARRRSRRPNRGSYSLGCSRPATETVPLVHPQVGLVALAPGISQAHRYGPDHAGSVIRRSRTGSAVTYLQRTEPRDLISVPIRSWERVGRRFSPFFCS
jgi:hypothetical protein